MKETMKTESANQYSKLQDWLVGIIREIYIQIQNPRLKNNNWIRIIDQNPKKYIDSTENRIKIWKKLITWTTLQSQVLSVFDILRRKLKLFAQSHTAIAIGFSVSLVSSISLLTLSVTSKQSMKLVMFSLNIKEVHTRTQRFLNCNRDWWKLSLR